MDKRLTQGSVWLTYTLCGILTIHPALANVVIDGSSANTSKTQAGNGVEVINIATPNGQGLSHNKYKQFNVDPEGLILNNSTAQLSQSQLGGLLQNNPNLNGKAADVILNEVTAANRSQLEGYTEVFGQQANVILANPYGITCDGCGFINTPRVTLSTGAPELNNGQLTGFDVSQGSVTIEGLGLDATNQTYFDIISRTAEINANIHANDLSVITGNNKVAYQSNQVTEKNLTPTNKPALAIDSSSLGGMYAGRIALVATEQGVGVNVGNLVSNVGDLSISANGNIVLGNANSAKNLILNSQQDVTLIDTQAVQEDMSLTAQNIEAQQSKIVVDEVLSVYADNVMLADAAIEAEQINTKVNDITVDEQSVLSATSITMTELSSLNNHGQVYARDTLSIQGDSTTLTEGGVIAASNVIIQSPKLSIDTRLQTDSAQIASDQLLTVTEDARIEATDNIALTTGQLDLIGETVANNQIDVTVDTVANIQGTLLGVHVNLAANDTHIQGVLHANEALTVTTDTLTNTGGITSSGVQQINVDSDMTNYGWVYAADSLDFRIQGTLLNQQGEILSGGDIQLRGRQGDELAQSFNNASGAIHANHSLSIYASTILNKPTEVNFNSETTKGDYTFGSVEGFSVGWGSSYTPETRTDKRNCNWLGWSCEHWKISKDTEVTLLTQTTNSTLTSSEPSQITADGNITLVSEQITNELGLIHAGQNLDVTTGALVNQGYTTGNYQDYSRYKHYSTEGKTISQFDYIRIDSQTQTLSENTHDSTIAAGGSVAIKADSQVNNSLIREKESSGVTGLAVQPIQQQSAATLIYPLPKNNNGLFIYQPDPKGKYLIETNPLLTDMGQFLGSDYFMSSVGFNPQADVKFLGDAYYDSKVISQAIFEQTGQRYLNQSVGSQLEQMQQLIDAAATQKNALNLSAGIALSADQIANLTQDIVWYEEVAINGETVLAPKLYLAQATLDNLNQGALIAATDVAINADNMTNSGRVSADASLNLTSTNNIDNLAGTLISNGDLSLLAEQDIINFSGDIQGGRVSLTAVRGDIVNETLATTLTSTQGSSSSTSTKLGKTASISSAGDLALNVGNSIKNMAADISSQGDIELTAGQNILVSSKENTLNASGSFSGEASASQIGSSVTADGNVSLNAGKDITITASQLASQQTLSLDAGNNVTVETALNKQSESTNLTNYTRINRSEQHQGSTLKGNNVTIKANNDATLSGSVITAKQSASIEAKGDVNILAVNDNQYHYDKTVTEKSFGRGKSTLNESYREQVKGSAITAGNGISIKAQNLDSAITAGGDSDINIIGSSLNAGGEVGLSADGDVTLAAQTYKEFERHETIKKGFAGLSGSHKGNIDDAALLEGSFTIAANDIDISSGRDIGVLASEVTAGGNVNLDALDEVLISSQEALKLSQEWSEEYGFFKGGNLFEMENQREGEATSTQQASQIHSDGNITINSGTMVIAGSELNAANDITLKADTGSIDIRSAENTSDTYSDHEKLSVGFGDMGNLVSVEEGQLRINLGEASYDKVDIRTNQTTQSGSTLSAGNHLIIEAESDISVTGSDLVANANHSDTGDLILSAENITIKEAKETTQTQTDETHGSAKVSVVVQHQAVEVAKAAQALEKSTQALKQAEKDYKQYKKQLDSLESTLATLNEELKQNKPGVTFEDVEELNDLIADVKSDEAWYVTGIAMASADVASKTTLLVQQTAAAIQSKGTYGFNAGLHLDLEASKTNSTSQQTSSVASNLSGNNIKIDAGSDTTVQGSNLKANEAIKIEADEVNLLASQDTQNSQSNTESGSVSASLTVYGASSGINLNASMSRNESTSASTTHTNSTLSADNISITSQSDTNVIGATVRADDTLMLDVGGDLNVASVQDRHTSSQKGMGISAGLSLSGGEVPEGGGALQNMEGAGNTTGSSGGLNASNGRTSSKETVLTSLTGNTVTITTGDNTDIKGALIAATDSEGKDTGNLTLETGTLTYNDLSNTNYTQNQSGGINTSVGIHNGEIDSTYNTTNIQYKNESGYSKSKTLASIGQGELTIINEEGSDDTTALNRDTEHTEKDLFTVDRKQGDIDVTVDHRLLSEEGRKAIAKDVETTHEAGQDVYRAAETYVKSDEMDLFDFGKSVSDNRKVTELKNELLSSQEGLDLLNDLKSTDPDKVLAAQAEISKKAQEKYGLEPEQVNFYDADKTTSIAMQDNHVRDVHGGVVTDDDHELHGEVNVDVSDATTKTELLNTLGHETYESITENTTGEQTAAQEDLANAFGNQLEDRVNQAAGGDLDSTTGANWNSALQNSQMVNQGTQRVNQVGNANVDHRMYRYNEAEVMGNIRNRIDSDKSLSNDQKQQANLQLSALACASVKCAEQVPESDPYHKQLTDLQNAGEQLQANGASLKGMLGEDAEGLFEHDWLDSVNDTVLKHDEGITKGAAIIDVVAGYGGASASVIGGAAICTGGVTCSAGVALATLGTDAGLEQGREGLNTLNEDYSSTIGESTLNSASTETHEGEVNPVGDLVIDAAVRTGTLVLEAVIAKAGGKALDKVVDVVDKAGPGTKVVDIADTKTVKNNDNFDSSIDNRGVLSSDGPTILEFKDAVDIKEFNRLNQVDIAVGKLKPGEASAAVEIQKALDGKLRRASTTDGDVDFVFTDGPNEGKTVDFMFTVNNDKQQTYMNKFFNNNFDKNVQQLKSHVEKADIVPLDFRNLDMKNQVKLMEVINDMSKEQSSKIVIIK